MAQINITKTELVWPGKYNEDGTRKEVPRMSLLFQGIETINESRATREAEKQRQPTLFDIWEGKEGDPFEDGWKNKLMGRQAAPAADSARGDGAAGRGQGRYPVL